MEQYYEILGWTIVAIIVLFIVFSFVSRRETEFKQDVKEEDFKYLRRDDE